MGICAMSGSSLPQLLKLLAGLVLASGGCLAAETENANAAPRSAVHSDPVDHMADVAPAASRSLLLDVARVGERLIAVGERGHVLLSADQGNSWIQAIGVPSRTMLTSLCFADTGRGWAVGHDEIILSTRDHGRTWMRSHYAPESQQPLLAVLCLDSQHVIAVGAYGSFFETRDGGVNWQARKFSYTRAAKPAATNADVPPDYHLNCIAATEKYLFIGAESGQIFRSADSGASWQQLPSPYKGSFFGLLPLNGDSLLVFGLRGNLFRTRDAGETWQKIETGATAMLTDGARLRDGTIVVVGLSGTVIASRDGGTSFKAFQQADRKGLSAVLALDDGRILAVGESGPHIVDVR